MPGSPDDLEPIDSWPSPDLEPLHDLGEHPDDTEDDLPPLPEAALLQPPDPDELHVVEFEDDPPVPALPSLPEPSPADLGPAIQVLSWRTEGVVDGTPTPAVLCPSEATTTLYDPRATASRRTVRVVLGPVERVIEVDVVPTGPARLHAGRDVLGEQILVSSTPASKA